MTAPRLQKDVGVLRHALELHVLQNRIYSSRKAAATANSASEAVRTGKAAEVTRMDVSRYGKPLLDLLEADEELGDARKRVEAARGGSADDVDAVVELRMAEGLFEARARWVSEKLRRAISEVDLKGCGNPDFVLQRSFGDDEETVLSTYFEYMSLAGFPLGLSEAREMLMSLALELGVSADFVASDSYLVGLQNRTGRKIAGRKASAICPRRAQAADPKVADAQFSQAEEYYQELKRLNPDVWPWATLADMPAHRVFNFDEEGEDANKRRGKVLAAKSLQENGLHRVFEVAPGDSHPPFHVTTVATICAVGTLHPPPMLIHSRPGNENPTLSHADAMHIYEKLDDDSYHTPTGVEVHVATNGSMTQEIFPFYVEHFLAHTEDDGLGNWLYFDGHVSRCGDL